VHGEGGRGKVFSGQVYGGKIFGRKKNIIPKSLRGRERPIGWGKRKIAYKKALAKGVRRRGCKKKASGKKGKPLLFRVGLKKGGGIKGKEGETLRGTRLLRSDKKKGKVIMRESKSDPGIVGHLC